MAGLAGRGQRAVTAASLAALCAAGCMLPLQSGTRVAPSAAAPHVPDAPDMRVLTEAQARREGLAGRELVVTFGEDETDGTRMLTRWFDRARAKGSRVGDLAMYVVHDRESDAVECRTAIVPERTVEPVFTAPSTQLESVYRPVQRMVMHSQQRCQLVMHPETHSETTYTTQYDYFSKSSRTVPQTRMVTTQVMRNECHPEMVSSFETQWEWSLQSHYSPPRVDYLTTNRLREGKPVCY